MVISKHNLKPKKHQGDAGHMARHMSGHVAGDVAGHMAGHMAGPAM